MAKFISNRNPVSAVSLKRKPNGTVIMRHHGGWEDIRFTRVNGGWKRERTDFTGLRPSVVSSASVADECNSAVGCADSWARIY